MAKKGERKRVVANEFCLKDGSGEIVAELRAADEGMPSLRFIHKGQIKCIMGVNPSGDFFFQVPRENDRAAFSLFVQQDVTSAGFADVNGKGVIGVTIFPDGHLMIEKTENMSVIKPIDIQGDYSQMS